MSLNLNHVISYEDVSFRDQAAKEMKKYSCNIYSSKILIKSKPLHILDKVHSYQAISGQEYPTLQNCSQMAFNQRVIN